MAEADNIRKRAEARSSERRNFMARRKFAADHLSVYDKPLPRAAPRLMAKPKKSWRKMRAIWSKVLS